MRAASALMERSGLIDVACGYGRAIHECVNACFHTTWGQAAAEALPAAGRLRERQTIGQLLPAVRSACQLLLQQPLQLTSLPLQSQKHALILL